MADYIYTGNPIDPELRLRLLSPTTSMIRGGSVEDIVNLSSNVTIAGPCITLPNYTYDWSSNVHPFDRNDSIHTILGGFMDGNIKREISFQSIITKRGPTNWGKSILCDLGYCYKDKTLLVAHPACCPTISFLDSGNVFNGSQWGKTRYHGQYYKSITISYVDGKGILVSTKASDYQIMAGKESTYTTTEYISGHHDQTIFFIGLLGAGGGGGGGAVYDTYTGGYKQGGGGGGGGGGFCFFAVDFAVLGTGKTIEITVGSGGSGSNGAFGSSGSSGTPTRFTVSGISGAITAEGGAGGFTGGGGGAVNSVWPDTCKGGAGGNYTNTITADGIYFGTGASGGNGSNGNITGATSPSTSKTITINNFGIYEDNSWECQSVTASAYCGSGGASFANGYAGRGGNGVTGTTSGARAGESGDYGCIIIHSSLLY